MNYLITGGCGFIGCNFIRRLFAENADVSVTNIDLLTYAGSEENLADIAANLGLSKLGGERRMALLHEELDKIRADLGEDHPLTKRLQTAVDGMAAHLTGRQTAMRASGRNSQ